jgi:flagellar biosynthesis protein FlhF
MRIIRQVAPDMRQALRAIREQLGEDAVILSSRRTPEGVEVTAAVDLDTAQLHGAAQASPETSPEPPPPAPAPSVAPPRAAARGAAANAEFSAALEESLRLAARPPASAPAAAAAPTLNAMPVAAPPVLEPATTASADSAAAAPAGIDSLSREIKVLRRMLESQLELLAWNDRTRRMPVVTETLRELTEMGVSQELAERITAQFPENIDLANARRFALTALSQYLQVSNARWLEEGARLAFVGATGVGKTTSLAKLAVRWVLRHGPRDVALVAADAVRIGAQDQLQALGQLLGAPVYVPDKFSGLASMLAQLSRYRLILIDTPGASVRDPQLVGPLSVLANSASQLESVLVLPANAQAGALEEAVRRFAPANPSCCLLTKLDEAASLGGALSVLIRARLPVAFVSEGQRVPEDLQPARALDLVSIAVRLAKTNSATADEDLLRRRFGKVAHAP